MLCGEGSDVCPPEEVLTQTRIRWDAPTGRDFNGTVLQGVIMNKTAIEEQVTLTRYRMSPPSDHTQVLALGLRKGQLPPRSTHTP